MYTPSTDSGGEDETSDEEEEEVETIEEIDSVATKRNEDSSKKRLG